VGGSWVRRESEGMSSEGEDMAMVLDDGVEGWSGMVGSQ
jgi:hypothetical protein